MPRGLGARGSLMSSTEIVSRLETYANGAEGENSIEIAWVSGMLASSATLGLVTTGSPELTVPAVPAGPVPCAKAAGALLTDRARATGAAARTVTRRMSIPTVEVGGRRVILR